MTFIINGKKYRSKKHPMLELVFQKYFNSSSPNETIVFYLTDISEAYRELGMREPASISNTILDLCRKGNGINSRVPETISGLGYDLKKKTGPGENGKNCAGEFVYVGVGNELNSWLRWPEKMSEIVIDSSPIPSLVRRLIRKDESGLFSVIDYLDILPKVLGCDVYRIQNPMKWQPNEIDGFYASNINGDTVVFPIEAKALTTRDDVNLDQMEGAFRTVLHKLDKLNLNVDVRQIAVRMIKNGIDIAIFPENLAPIEPDRYVRVKFNPVIENWK
jgi:hypothetical protein